MLTGSGTPPKKKQGSVVIVQMALGQKNIDDLLKLSDEYKKSAYIIIILPVRF